MTTHPLNEITATAALMIKDARIAELLTEIERLRAALREIRDNGYRAALCHAVAKTALEQKSP
jgi:hypothetical protein